MTAALFAVPGGNGNGGRARGHWPLDIKANEALILAHLIAHPDGLSQAELAKRTNLSQPTVSRALDPLHRQEVVWEASSSRQSRGRRSSLWRVEHRLGVGRWVIGINLRDDFGAPGHLQGVAAHLDGNEILVEEEILSDRPITEAAVVGRIADLVGRLCHKAHDEHGRSLLGVGVSLGGHVRDGSVVRSHNLGWASEVALQADLEKALRARSDLQVPVLVENNANTFASRYNRIGGDGPWRAVVVLNYRGIGCGLFLNGELYRGDDSKAGELGHFPVPIDVEAAGCTCAARPEPDPECRFTCRCGKHGCLETIATPYALQQELGANSLDEAAERVTNHSEARRTFERAGESLGHALAVLVTLLDPSRVLLLGHRLLVDGSPSAAAYLGGMNAALDRYTFGRRTCTVTPHAFGGASEIQAQAASASASDVVQRFLGDALRRVE